MSFQFRLYNGVSDLQKLLNFVGNCNAMTSFCGGLHTGDVRHNMSNLLRGADPHRYFGLWEDGAGELLGVVMLYPPRFSGFEMQVHPEHRGGALEVGMIAWGEAQTWASTQAVGSDKVWVGTDVMDCDSTRHNLLVQAGYVPGEAYMRYTRRSLLDPIPEAVLPEGFTIRPVEGEHEAEALAKVHSSAFGSNWKASEYLDAIRSPAFEIDHELVVVAPEGELAAFLVYWIDPVTNSGLFEPVGCGEKFQRQGLTKALMYEAMRRMRTEGVIAALVLHELDNPASTALYASVGFRPVYTLHKYKKQMRAEAGS